MAIRITYDTKTIDLLVAEDGIQPDFKQYQSQNRSGSGKIETINQYGLQELEFHAYFSQAVYYDLLAWWSWARQGKPWAFAMNNSKTGDTSLDGSAAAGQKTVPLTSTSGFTAGDICLVRAEDSDDEFEVVEIDTVNAGVSIVAVENLKFAYASGDTFRHLEYWPAAISLDDNFKPVKTGATYRHTFKFAEAL